MTASAQQPYGVRGYAFVQLFGMLKDCHELITQTKRTK